MIGFGGTALYCFPVTMVVKGCIPLSKWVAEGGVNNFRWKMIQLIGELVRLCQITRLRSFRRHYQQEGSSAWKKQPFT